MPILKISDKDKERLQKTILHTEEWHTLMVPVFEKFISELINTTKVEKKGVAPDEWGRIVYQRDEAAKILKDLLLQFKSWSNVEKGKTVEGFNS